MTEVNSETFVEMMLEESERELRIGDIEIYRINNKYVLFQNGQFVRQEIDGQSNVQPSLQGAVDVALEHMESE